MAGFVKALDLLPQPAGFEREEDCMKRKSCSEAVTAVLRTAVKRSRRKVLLVYAAVAAAGSAATLLFSFRQETWPGIIGRIPETYMSPETARYFLMGFFGMALAWIAGKTVRSLFRNF